MRRLLEWERDAIVDAYASKEKTDAICAEFNVCHSYPGNLAKRRGLKPRAVGRPSTISLQTEKRVLLT